MSGRRSAPTPLGRASVAQVDPDEVRRKMRLDYIRSKNDKPFKVLEALQGLLSHFQKPELDINGLLQEAADLIHKQFGLRTVTIGLRSKFDGKYRYVINSGLRPEPWEQHQQITYGIEDFQNFERFNGFEISRLTRIYLEEQNPMTAEERKIYNRPALLDLKRRGLDENLEADYLDVLIKGTEDTLLGWIEISGTIGGKLPDSMTIKNIETISMILAAALMCKDASQPGG